MEDSLSQIGVTVFKNEEYLYFSLSGKLLRTTVSVVEKAIDEHFSSEFDRILFNLRNLSFIDSAGLGMLVALKVRCSKHHMQFMVLEPSEEVSRIFSVSRLEKIFPVLSDSEAQQMRRSIEIDSLCATAAEHSSSPLLSRQSNETRPMETPKRVSQMSATEMTNELCRDAVDKVRLGEYEEAVEIYQQVLAIDPSCISALNNLALLYQKKPDWAPEALETWKRVEEVSRQTGDQKHLLRAQRRLAVLRSDPLSFMDPTVENQDTING